MVTKERSNFSIKLVTTKEIADILGVTTITIGEWRKFGMPYFKRKRAVRFSVEEVIDWYRAKKGNKSG